MTVIIIMMCFIFLKLVAMENPYKEPEKGCVLCNVAVDFKNIQVRVILLD